MEKLNKIGIYNLCDLIDYGVQNFKSNLLDEWNKILFFDNSINHNSSRLTNYKNPLYWQGLTNRKNNSSFNKHKKILREITLHYSQNIQDEVYKIIAQKVDELFPRGSQIDGLYIQSIQTPPASTNKDNVCAITGLNISMQKKGSILLSHTGLNYYFKTDKKIFEELKRKYLSSKWRTSDHKTQIKELAHNIRNTKSNTNIISNRKYPKFQYNLLSQIT